MRILTNCKIFTGEEFLTNKAVITENGKVISICDESEVILCDTIDCGGGILTSGFIDMQVNGGGGILFNDDPTEKTIMQIYNSHAAFGTACICPTFITDSMEKLTMAIKAVDECDECIIPAIHIEGFLISEKKSGIHDKRYIVSEERKFADMLLNSGKCKVVLTVAPEVLNNCGKDLLNALSESRFIIFGGHSDASYECFAEFLENGAVGATHLYNAMSQMQSRAPGVCGAVFDSDRAVAGIIADGYHVEYTCVRVAKQIMGERLFLVTDAMPPACSDIEEYTLYGNKIHVKNGVCISDSGTIAGSCLSMLRAVKNCVENNVANRREAFRMASLYPARVLGIDDMGEIQKGARALFTLTNENLTKAEVIRF